MDNCLSPLQAGNFCNVQKTKPAPENEEDSNICQEVKENLDLFEAPTRSPKDITVAGQVVLRAMRETPSSVPMNLAGLVEVGRHEYVCKIMRL